MRKKYRLLSAVFFSVYLSACGGGDESKDPVTPPPITPPKNTVPTLTISKVQVELAEKTSETISFIAKDSDGDSLSYLIESNNVAVVSAKVQDSMVIITANEVENDVTAIVKLTVSDGKDTAVKSISIKVINDAVVVNTPPNLTLSTLDYAIPESSTGSVGFTAIDPDGDTLSFSVKSSNSVVVPSIVGNNVNLVSGEVNVDSMSIIEVSVTDGVNVVSQSFTVNVIDSGNYAPFSLSWVDSENTSLYVAQAAQGRYKFNIQLGSVSLNSLNVNVKMTPDIASSINLDSGEIIVSTDKDTLGKYSGVMTVSDGVNSQVLSFNIEVYKSNRNPFLDTDYTVFLNEGESKTISLSSSNSLDPESVRIYEVQPFQIIDGDSSKFELTYDNTARTYTIKALAGSKLSGLLFYVFTTDSYGSWAGGIYEAYVKGSKTPLEVDLEEKLILAQKYVKQSQEIERLGDFVIDALEMKGVLSQKEAMVERLLISDSRYFSDTLSANKLNCMLSAVQKGFVENKTIQYENNGVFKYQEGYICNVGEVETFDHGTATATTNFYENSVNYAIALNNIDQIKNTQDSEYLYVQGENLVQRVNRLALLLSTTDSSFQLGDVVWNRMNDIGNGLYSRFVGTSTYGSYNNGVWTWNPEYKFLGVATQMANETVNY